MALTITHAKVLTGIADEANPNEVHPSDWAAVHNITGTIGVTNGGSGLASATLGDVWYASATNTLSALAGNTTTTRKFLRQTGTGTVSAAPAWDTIQSSDLPTLYPINANSIFISTSGNDSNSGTSGGSPLLTFGAVLTLIQKMRGTVQVSIADGTYDITSAIGVFGEHTQQARHDVLFTGNVVSPGNVIIRANTNGQTIFDVEDYGAVIISGVTLVANTGVTGVVGLYSRQHAIADINTSVFGSMPSGTHEFADEHGTLNEGANITISGGAFEHYHVRDGGVLTLNAGVTITGTPTFDGVFALVESGGILTSDDATITYTGSINGAQFSYDVNAIVKIGSTVIPGSGAGTDRRQDLKIAATAVSGLPAAGTAGRKRFVTDANATTFASIVAGGGSNGVPVFDDGTNWRIG